jgi:hypothetical protein
MEYNCPVCGVAFETKEWAEKCKKWCSKNKSCNLDIMKHAK